MVVLRITIVVFGRFHSMTVFQSTIIRRSGRSSPPSLVRLISITVSSCHHEQSLTSGRFGIGFAKAFDKVPHRRLLVKLKHYNLNQQVTGWIESLLSSRTQRVVVDGYMSQEAPVLSGVPQGTVLGPLLFLIFINDITENVSSPIRLFADDCLIQASVKSGLHLTAAFYRKISIHLSSGVRHGDDV